MFSRIASKAADFGSFFRGLRDRGGDTGGTRRGGGVELPGSRDTFDRGTLGRKQTSNYTTKPTLVPGGDGGTKSSVFSRLFDRFNERFPKLGETLKTGWDRLLKHFTAYSSTKPTLVPGGDGGYDGGYKPPPGSNIG